MKGLMNRRILMGFAVLFMAGTLPKLWMIVAQSIAGFALLFLGLRGSQKLRRCKSCGYLTKHGPNCRELLTTQPKDDEG